MTLATQILGPIVCTAQLERQADFFGAFGLERAGEAAYDPRTVQALWGVEGRACREWALTTPGTPFGVRLLAFDPPSPETIREPARSYDSEAPKVVDFYAPDIHAAKAAIEARGFPFKSEIAEYEIPEGRCQEGQVVGPDNVICALISGSTDFFARFATVRDRLTSEPQSLSGPVKDRPKAAAFFEQVFGLGVVYRYGIDDDRFARVVGSKPHLNLSAWNIGVRTEEPYFGLIDYGLDPADQISILDRAHLPRRGLIGATILVQDAEEVRRRAEAARALATPVWTGELPRLGRCAATLVSPPSGGACHAVQPL